MSDKPIKIGDLVMVVKPKPCCGNGRLGFPFKVMRIKWVKAICMHCQETHFDWYALDEQSDIYLMSRLKLIPPEKDLLNKVDEMQKRKPIEKEVVYCNYHKLD